MKDNRFILMLKCINIVLIALMACIVALFAVLPFIQNLISQYFIYLLPTFVFFYVAGSLLLWFFYNLKRLMTTVREDTAFTGGNVKRLKRLSVALFFLALDFVYSAVYIPSLSKVLCIIILVIGAFCARILAYLTEKAIEYKEDVDLTI